MGTKYSWKKSDPIKACQNMSKTIRKIWGHSLLMTQFANNLDVLKKKSSIRETMNLSMLDRHEHKRYF